MAVTPSLRSRAGSERSEGAGSPDEQILRCAQDDSQALRMTARTPLKPAHGTERPAPVALTRVRYCTDRKPVSGPRWDRPAGETPGRDSQCTQFPEEREQWVHN